MTHNLDVLLTQSPAARSIDEIVAALTNAGAELVEPLYDEAHEPTGIEWSQKINHRLRCFRISVQTEPLYRALTQSSGCQANRNARLHTFAQKLAWLEIRLWIKLQLNFVELGMFEYGQAFLPFLKTIQGQTTWEQARPALMRQKSDADGKNLAEA